MRLGSETYTLFEGTRELLSIFRYSFIKYFTAFIRLLFGYNYDNIISIISFILTSLYELSVCI